MGKLRRILYGNRNAPLAWQKVVRGYMLRMGYQESKVTIGVFVHLHRDIKVVTHVDDFLVSAEARDVNMFKEYMARKYELKADFIGWEPGGQRESEFSGRKIRATETGVEFEGGSKHVEKLAEEWGMQHCKPVATPNVKESSGGATGADLCVGDQEESTRGAREETSNNPSSGPDATRYPRAAARINYIAQDRPDLSFASKVAAIRMGSPDEEDEEIIKGIIRYLQGRPVANFHYGFQVTPHQRVVYTD